MGPQRPGGADPVKKYLLAALMALAGFAAFQRVQVLRLTEANAVVTQAVKDQAKAFTDLRAEYDAIRSAYVAATIAFDQIDASTDAAKTMIDSTATRDPQAAWDALNRCIIQAIRGLSCPPN